MKCTINLTTRLNALKGIGPKRAELFAQKGLHTVLDLLFFLPIRYEDRTQVLPINKTREGQPALVRGDVVSGQEVRFFRSGKKLYKIKIADETGHLELLWFQYKRTYFRKIELPGEELFAFGRVHENRGGRQIIHPDISLVSQAQRRGVPGFLPVYPAIKGLPVQLLRSAIREALDRCQHALTDPIPTDITSHLSLPSLGDAVRFVHVPPKGSSIDLLNQFKTRYHKRLVFDRFFRVMLGISFRKRCRERASGPAFVIPEDLVHHIENCLPFTLTGDQVRTIEEILMDLGSGRPMNRLVQGDVGCGKTVVAAAAAYAAILNEWQVAVMAPTQVLARQHHEYFSGLSVKMGFRPFLLTGALKSGDRATVYEKIAQGKYNIILGTHALISEGLSFARLGLVVIDEQHRFGVRQRALLGSKGTDPHLLVMSATPIPRTLAMTAYADLDISTIKEYPAGHRPVRTYLVNENEKRHIFNTLSQKISKGQQAIIVCPVIENSEDADLKGVLDMHVKLRKLFEPRFRVGLVHGRLSPDEKDSVLQRFRNGLIDVLVGTTVIEVGIHAKGATVMIIEHPERFGLAQIHQLRGRVGRGSERGICFLMASGALADGSLERLKVLVESHDGFEIARKDLEMRGQGELMGIRQAGAGELDFGEIFREPDLFMAAKEEADRLLNSDPGLSSPENRYLRDMVARRQVNP